MLVLLAVALPGGGVRAAEPSPASGTAPAVNAYAGRTDEELTALAADWDALDRHQRRALLTEMKLRMARQGESKGVLHIRTERRYGRIIRQSDGRVIRIETQVVHVRPASGEELRTLSGAAGAADAEGRQGFGVGFERRVARRARTAPDESSAPATADAARSAPTLEEVLESLEPPPGEPVVRPPLPIRQVADPAP